MCSSAVPVLRILMITTLPLHLLQTICNGLSVPEDVRISLMWGWEWIFPPRHPLFPTTFMHPLDKEISRWIWEFPTTLINPFWQAFATLLSFSLLALRLTSKPSTAWSVAWWVVATATMRGVSRRTGISLKIMEPVTVRSWMRMVWLKWAMIRIYVNKVELSTWHSFLYARDVSKTAKERINIYIQGCRNKTHNLAIFDFNMT